MPYLHEAIFGVALLIFLFVVLGVGLAVIVTIARRNKAKPGAIIYPIPPSERGTGAHTSLLDLVDQHVIAEDIRRRREKFSGRLYEFVQDAPPPKA